MEGLEIKLLVSIIDESVSKSQKVFIALLESCWDHFYPYLSNEDIGKIDSALTEKSLREIYIKQVSEFYRDNHISSPTELEWIMRRGIDLTVCRLDFDNKGITALSNLQTTLVKHYLCVPSYRRI